MNIYNELIFAVDECKDLFVDLVFSLGIDAIEEKENQIIIRSSNSLDEIEYGLCEFAKALELNGKKVNLSIQKSQKDNIDWIEKYKHSIQPIKIDDLYIHTSWQEPQKDCINITIDPALAFGSGHHESTHSCLHFLQKYIKKDMLAFDLGCGSGILSIAMSKLGANVDACDTCEQAISSLKENAKINNVKLNDLWLGSTSFAMKSNKKYEIIVANIIADVILMLQVDLKNLLKDNAILILSGIIDKYEENIKKTFSNLCLIDEIKKNEWVTLVFKNKV